MNTKPVGYLLIINNEEFKNREGNISKRGGTDVDAKRLRGVFSRRGFEIIEKKNLSAKVSQLVLKYLSLQIKLFSSIEFIAICQILIHSTALV